VTIVFAITSLLSIFGFIQFGFSSILGFLYRLYAFAVVYSIWRKFQEVNNPPKPRQIAVTIEQNVA
jgi:Kef-type K+ transport system membrane component KefB